MKFLVFTGVLLVSSPMAAQECWELVKQSSTVSVYTSDVPGSLYQSFKAVGIAHTTPQRLLAILDDVSSYPEWFAYSNTVRPLERAGNKKYVYMETDFPWPFRNQDMTYLLSTAENGDGGVKLILKGMPEHVPAMDGIQRMHAASGYILLQPVGGHTIVTYLMHIELGSDIPPWLANRHIHRMPFKTIRSFIEIAER